MTCVFLAACAAHFPVDDRAWVAKGERHPVVVLKRGKARLFREGNPIVFPGAIDSILGNQPALGDPVVVADGSRKPIAWGVYNPTSLYAVRVLQSEAAAVRCPDAILDPEAAIRNAVASAASLRGVLGLGVQGSGTSVFRLINSEGDGLSGLTADVLGDVVVVSCTAAWLQLRRPAVESALRAVAAGDVVWRTNPDLLRQEGLEIGAGESEAEPGKVVEVEENGVLYGAEPWGQKSGFYADQRDNRAVVRSLARGREVLDVCCYSGGFALSAALGGAARAKGIDSSDQAITLAASNAERNGVADRCTFERAEAAAYMDEAFERGEQYDIVVLDPPKLAPNRKALDRARGKYVSLNRKAMRLVRPGGLLMTCSCSGAVAQGEGLEPMVRTAAEKEGRSLAVLREAGPGPDHPVDPSYPEGRYLSNLLVRVL
ncbi:unnamed protein product [Pedinophyceae sp. YPF-701]|nr:unnamed protein product [Pedinophyceae sp. YPF-701]